MRSQSCELLYHECCTGKFVERSDKEHNMIVDICLCSCHDKERLKSMEKRFGVLVD